MKHLSKEFLQCLLRLKLQLAVEIDQDVAEALGMESRAFQARKQRSSFPVDRLYAVAAQRPELGLDVEYILTGVSTSASPSHRDETMLAAFDALWTPPTYEEMTAFMDAEMKRLGVGPFAAEQGVAA